MLINTDKKVVVIIVLLSLVIVSIWFKDHKLLATGEEGLLFFNPTRSFNNYSHLWAENYLGRFSPLTLPRIPILYFASFLYPSLPVYVIQALVFFLALYFGMLGMYFLSSYFMKSSTGRLLATLFYFFNLYSQTQVWRRFILAGIFAWGYLPFFLYIWFRWIDTGKKKLLVIFFLINLIFSSMYSSPAFTITLFTPLFIWLIYKLLKLKNKRLIIMKRFVLGLIFWSLINVWWIYPYLKTLNMSYSGFSTWRDNYYSLMGVSESFPVKEVFLLKQKSFFNTRADWYKYYDAYPIKIISYITLAVLVIGIFNYKKIKNYRYLLLIGFIGLFISKGTNPPLGKLFYKFLFSNFGFTNVLRNSYEKFGIVWLMFYSMFWSVGIISFFKSKKIILRIFSAMLIFSAIVILVKPIWDGSIILPYVKVEVPQYYLDTNNNINNQRNDGRILILPIVWGDGICLKWGYDGVEPSDNMFDRPTVSRLSNTEQFDGVYKQLLDSLKSGIDLKIFDQLNIKYIILRRDLCESFEDVYPFKVSYYEGILQNEEKIKKVEVFGDLSVYEDVENVGNLFSVMGDDPPAIKYKKIGNANYKVWVENAKSDFSLIMKESYNSKWGAEINGNKINDHEIIYGYANKWVINEKGSYEVDVNLKI